MFRRGLFLALCVAIFGSAKGQYVAYQSTDSDNIHSNDTLALELAGGIYDVLRVTPGSKQQIELVFINRGRTGDFLFSGQSEDGLRGRVMPQEAFVEHQGEVRIQIFDLEVPNDPRFIGKKLKYKVNAMARGLFRRSAEEAPENYDNEDMPMVGDRYDGRGGSYDGRGSSGQTGGTFNQGGGTFDGGNRGNQGLPVNPNAYRPPAEDPANRREISKTLLFSVVEDSELYEDTTSPYMGISYIAQTEDETCRSGPEDPACALEWWSAIFNVYDVGTGLNSVSLKLDGHQDQILGGVRRDYYYRYSNFPIGEVDEQKIFAGATCCHPSFTLTVTDVAGNKESLKAYSSEYGTPWFTPTIMYIIIGVSVLVLVIIIVVLAYCGWRQRWCYKEVSQNP